jgi:hypothetical protein
MQGNLDIGEVLDLAQTANMIGVPVGQQDEIDLSGRNAEAIHTMRENPCLITNS